MKHLLILSLLFVSNLLRAGEFHSAYITPPALEEYHDQERGIHITITNYPDQDPESSYQGGTGERKKIGRLTYAFNYSYSDTQTTVTQILLSESTIRYLLSNRESHLYLRNQVLSSLSWTDLPKKTIVSLYEKALKSPYVNLRETAFRNLFGIYNDAELQHLVLNNLNDPCISLAHQSLDWLIEKFDLVDENGKSPKSTTVWKGLATGLYRVQYLEILQVASLLQKKHPSLISPETINSIVSREIPGDDWFHYSFCPLHSRELTPDQLKDYRESFRQIYLDKKPSKKN